MNEPNLMGASGPVSLLGDESPGEDGRGREEREESTQSAPRDRQDTQGGQELSVHRRVCAPSEGAVLSHY